MNNRQNNNRRRGRGGNRQGGNRGGGGVDHQNRIDNRARGNASQMLDKYKKLAQDAQLNDDRVNAEYYHQFADHYFRVLADYRSRQEAKQEERRAREDERGHDGDQDDDKRGNKREAKAETSGSSDDTEDKPQKDKPARKERAPRSRAPRRSRDEEPSSAGAGDKDGIDLAVLPPSIGSEDSPAEEKPKRKPRARKAKPVDDSGEEVATAAE